MLEPVYLTHLFISLNNKVVAFNNHSILPVNLISPIVSI